MAGMVTSGILFAINTTGGGKSKLQFMAVAAAVGMAAKAFVSFAKDAQSLHQTFIQLSDANRQELAELEMLNKGIIDTGATMKMFATLNKAGMTDTGDLMKAMTKIVIDEGQKVGKTAEQITADFTQLGEGIAKGSGRQLKKLGIDLQETEDLLLMQEEALWKVQDRAEGLNVELRTLSEQTFATKNSWDTYTQLLWGSIGKSGVIGQLNEGLDASSEALILAGESTDKLAQADYIARLAGESLKYNLIGKGDAADQLDTKIQKLLKSMRAVAQVDATISKFTAGVSEGGKYIETAELAPFDPFAGESVDLGLVGDQGAASLAATKAAARPDRGGGGGRAAAATGADMFTAAEMRAAEAEYKLQEAMTVTSVAFEERDNILQAEAATQEMKWQLELETKEQEKLLSVEHHEWLLMNSEEYAAKQAEIDRGLAAEQVRIHQQAEKQKYDTAMYGANLMSGMAKNMSSLMQSDNKKQFEVGKKFAYASAVMDTAMGAASAIAGGIKTFGIPWGLVAGLAAAGTVAVAGGVQIATIKRQKFGASGGGVSSGAVGSGGGGYLGGGGNYAAGGAGGSSTTNITVILGEEEFHGWSVAANEKASQAGKPAFAQEAA